MHTNAVPAADRILFGRILTLDAKSSVAGAMAVAGGRLALVPAAIGFGPEPDGQIRADLSLVLADARTGKVVWRSLAYGRGKSPDEALNAALAAVLPLDGGQ